MALACVTGAWSKLAVAEPSTVYPPRVADSVIEWTLNLAGNEEVQSVNPLVGETNDGFLNDIRGRHVGRDEVFRAISTATNQVVEEGSVGAGTGTVAGLSYLASLLKGRNNNQYQGQ